MITTNTIRARHSVRNYIDEPLPKEEFDALADIVAKAARESGLDIQLIGNNPEAFNVLARFGVIRGCRTHVAFVVDGAADETTDELIGYWGQHIVLAAQDVGLNTCWCGICARKKSHAVVSPGRKIRLVIAVGHGKTQGSPRKTKSVEELSAIECGEVPAWFAQAMEAAQLAPTAMNNQHFKITLLADGKTVRAEAPTGGYNLIDLGIVKRNFEIAANEAGADWYWETKA